MERGSVQHGARVDDELAHELTPLLHGAPNTPREREDRASEDMGPGEQGSGPLGTPREAKTELEVTHEEVVARSELARWLMPSSFPCEVDTIVSDARGLGAPDELIAQLETLPPGRLYETAGSVWTTLGGHSEHREPAHEETPSVGAAPNPDPTSTVPRHDQSAEFNVGFVDRLGVLVSAASQAAILPLKLGAGLVSAAWRSTVSVVRDRLPD